MRGILFGALMVILAGACAPRGDVNVAVVDFAVTGPVTPNPTEPDAYDLPIRLTYTNTGTARTGLFRVAVYWRNADPDSRTSSTSFTGLSQAAGYYVAYPEIRNLRPGEARTITDVVTLRSAVLPSGEVIQAVSPDVVVFAEVDTACGAYEINRAGCLLDETDEADNRSDLIPISIPLVP